MARNYDMDTKAAAESNTGGKIIRESGPYIGVFKYVFWEKNQNGTESMNFLFVADSGQEVGPIALYTHNGKGEELPSYKTFNAILAVLGVQKIVSRPGKVQLYDFDQKASVEKSKDTYPDLMNKRIGVFLHREEYENRNQELKERMTIFGPFRSADKAMADEIVHASATPGIAYKRIAEWMASHPVKPLKTRTATRASASYQAPAQPGPDFVDDDLDSVPF
jgi:hypothetical protein